MRGLPEYYLQPRALAAFRSALKSGPQPLIAAARLSYRQRKSFGALLT